jgi:hypothetical protein
LAGNTQHAVRVLNGAYLDVPCYEGGTAYGCT